MPTHPIPSVTFAVPDMSCAHCVRAIRAALADALPGAAVAIDVVARRVTVAGDGAVAAAALREAGYEPVAA